MDQSTFEEVKLYLQQTGAGGQSLFDHLSELIEKLETVAPEERNALFEEISKEIKLSSFVQTPSRETELDEKVWFY